jgi:DNA-binding transcriptional LysR family regulator
MNIDLRLLRYALTLSEHHNFARAAAALGITQPALSRSIQNLERSIGTALFNRQPQGVEPTDAGCLFLVRARELIIFSEEFAHDIRQTGKLQRGRILCGVGPYAGEGFVGPAAGRFTAKFPGIQIELRVRNWDVLLRELRARDLDYFIAESSTLLEETDLEITPFKSQPLYFVGRAEHPLPKRKAPLERLLDFPILAPARIPPRLLAPILKSHPNAIQEQAFPSIECSSISLLKQIVRHSDAITALPLTAMREELDDRRLRILHAAPWLHLSYGIVRLKNRKLTVAAETFLSFVQEQQSELESKEDELLTRYVR